MTDVKVLSQAMIFLLLVMTSGLVSAGKSWANKQDHHLHGNFLDSGTPKSHVNRLDVVCSKDHMTVNMFFDDPFYGMVYSHASPHHERCIHVGPRSGAREITFHIRYDSCGTVEDLSGQFHENTIVIQYGEDILEAWDEAKRLRCEWLESFEKHSSKPTLSISDIDTVELNFQGDDIDCWMEVQEGKGPWARQVGGLVPIGSPLTLVIAINDNSREFDMRVKKCSASDGSGSEVQLTDQSGCVLRPSLLTPFAKIRDFGGKATLVAYSHLFAFKFPDTLDVYVHCIVEVCRHGCPDSCGGKLLTDYHPNSRDHFHTLESKKHQKLVEFTNSKQTTIHNVQATHHRQRPQYLTQVPAHVLQESLSGKGKNNEALLSQEHQVRQSVLKNASTASSFINKHLSNAKHSSYLANIHHQLAEAPENVRPKPEIHDSASNIHIASKETNSHIRAGHLSNSEHKVISDIKPVPIGHYHRIIGHDAHWNSEEVKLQDEQYIKHHIPPLKGISHQPPQPEPAAWSADEVKPLTKQQVFNPHVAPKQIPHHVKHFIKESLTADLTPQPEPAAWSADEVKPLTKQQVFNPHVAPKQIPHHVTQFIKESLTADLAPQPEPAAWSADDVKPLTKEQVYHPHVSHHHVANFKDQQHEDHTRFAVSKDKISHNKPHPSLFPPTLPQNPQPEPASWTFDEVNPMHLPEILRPHIEKVRLEEPKPEPSPWSPDEVKPLTKQDLKAHSLNYKLKTNYHQTDAHLPLYKESVLPYGTSTAPAPIYVPKYTPPPQNMSNTMMMKMMMMMPTLLPFTYQTARWPQKTTARHLRPDRQNYPYPIPQFPHKQQLMLGVIADRRMDGDEGDLQYELDPESHLSAPDIESDLNKSIISNGSNVVKHTTEGGITINKTPGELDNPAMYNESGTSSVLTHATSLDGVQKPETSNDQSLISKSEKTQTASAIRPPVSGFVPPTLDIDELNQQPQNKDRSAHSPRALNRRKRSSEPVFGVKQKFQAIALSDLAFELNVTRDSTTIFQGRREEIIYGICMSPASMSVSIGFILILTLCSLMASLVLYEHSCRLRNKTSHLSLLTRTFNGRLESLYRVSRQHPNSNCREVG